jgi:hypothetical protein
VRVTPLAEIMARHQLTDALVSSALACTRNAVRYWRTGQGVPDGRKLVRLLAYLRRFEPRLEAAELLPAEREGAA